VTLYIGVAHPVCVVTYVFARDRAASLRGSAVQPLTGVADATVARVRMRVRALPSALTRLPGSPVHLLQLSNDMTPKEIVNYLNSHIVGQADAKRAIAIAMRNRWRRMQLSSPLKDEVVPKNILMIGPTGVGKTEVARRLAKLAGISFLHATHTHSQSHTHTHTRTHTHTHRVPATRLTCLFFLSLSSFMAGAPFVKVEATKYTEVGFHGKDVDTMIKDLVDVAINLQRNKMKEAVKGEVSAAVENRILDILAGDAAQTSTRESFRALLREGALDERTIEVELPVNNGNKAAGGPVIHVCVCVRVCFHYQPDTSTLCASKTTFVIILLLISLNWFSLSLLLLFSFSHSQPGTNALCAPNTAVDWTPRERSILIINVFNNDNNIYIYTIRLLAGR
jgi:hypothetical protein